MKGTTSVIVARVFGALSALVGLAVLGAVLWVLVMNPSDRAFNAIMVLMIYLVPFGLFVFCVFCAIKVDDGTAKVFFVFFGLFPFLFLVGMLARMLPEPDDRLYNPAARSDTGLLKTPLQKRKLLLAPDGSSALSNSPSLEIHLPADTKP
ncbi:MAG: hypothetical protein HZC54_15385 [Verrucomicrobia bacterium]|nr:hypothetical protein [Verrucomicrobiota bacterium]